MNIRDYASQFIVTLFTQNVDMGAHLKMEIGAKKYEAVLYTDHEQLIQQFQMNPSHVILIDLASLIVPIHEFIEKLLKISAEVRFLILAPENTVAALKKYSEFNVDSVVEVESKNLYQSVLQSLDQICLNIFRLYQNQQIFDELQTTKTQLENIQAILEKERMGPLMRPFQMRISEYRSAQSKEELLDLFFKNTQPQSWIFLKYVPSIQTFISVSTSNVPEGWAEGLSYKVPSKDKNFMTELITGQIPEAFVKYLTTRFEVPHIKFVPLIIKEIVEGVFVSTQDIPASIAEDFSLMSLVYSNLVYESQPRYLDIEDSLTGFYNQLFYKRILEKEVDRSRRAYSPLSVVKIKIDKFIEIEGSHGKVFLDEIIKKVAEQIKNTSRLPDYVCRTDENEFSLVLINCHKKGAAIRAERLRQVLNLESFSKAGLKISVSQGIAEFPTMTNSIQELDRMASDALEFISSKGGDKICIAKPSKDHQPEFTVDL